MIDRRVPTIGRARTCASALRGQFGAKLFKTDLGLVAFSL
jgi:hypothetical protein